MPGRGGLERTGAAQASRFPRRARRHTSKAIRREAQKPREPDARAAQVELWESRQSESAERPLPLRPVPGQSQQPAQLRPEFQSESPVLGRRGGDGVHASGVRPRHRVPAAPLFAQGTWERVKPWPQAQILRPGGDQRSGAPGAHPVLIQLFGPDASCVLPGGCRCLRRHGDDGPREALAL